MSSTSVHDVIPENLIQVGFCRSGSLWDYTSEITGRLSPLPLYDSAGERICLSGVDFPSDLECTCGTDSSEEGSVEVKAESPVPRPLFVVGPGFSVRGPLSLPANEATLPMPVLQPEWIASDVNRYLEKDLDGRISDYEAEGEVRKNLFGQWITEAWVNVASHTLHTDETGREDFRRRPNWSMVELVVNTALATSYKGPGPPPTLCG